MAREHQGDHDKQMEIGFPQTLSAVFSEVREVIQTLKHPIKSLHPASRAPGDNISTCILSTVIYCRILGTNLKRGGGMGPYSEPSFSLPAEGTNDQDYIPIEENG